MLLVNTSNEKSFSVLRIWNSARTFHFAPVPLRCHCCPLGYQPRLSDGRASKFVDDLRHRLGASGDSILLRKPPLSSRGQSPLCRVKFFMVATRLTPRESIHSRFAPRRWRAFVSYLPLAWDRRSPSGPGRLGIIPPCSGKKRTSSAISRGCGTNCRMETR